MCAPFYLALSLSLITLKLSHVVEFINGSFLLIAISIPIYVSVHLLMDSEPNGF